MTRRAYFGGIAAVCATVLISAGLVAQDTGYEQQKEMSPEEAAMMEAWGKYMTPGPQHAELAERAGEWTIKGKFWEAPGTEPQTFEGSAHFKMIMEGRYLIEKVEGPFMGMPFKGSSILGYDNLTQTYVSAWIDNMGTGIMQGEGTPSGNGKIHWTMQQPDFINGRYKKSRGMSTKVDADHYKHVSYGTTPDGQEFKNMELHYTRNTD